MWPALGSAILSAGIFIMGSFSYGFGSNPPIDYPRLLISDTQEFAPAPNNTTPIYVFADQEIQAATAITQLPFQSAQYFSYPAGQTIPTSPVSYLRIAALLLDSLAANKARLSSIQKLLDVELDPVKAAGVLRDQAAEYRKIDDESGAFFIIEQVNDSWSFADRYWKQVQRQSGGGGGI